MPSARYSVRLHAPHLRIPSLVVGLSLAALFAGNAYASAPADLVAPDGCGMTHCNQLLSDQANAMPPVGPSVVPVFHDTSVPGSSTGVACSGNGNLVACSLAGGAPGQATTAVYRPDGSHVWANNYFDSGNVAAAPLVAADGSLIRTDGTHIARFDPTGKPLWANTIPGGMVISLNITDNRTLVASTYGGPVAAAYDPDTGQLLGQLDIAGTINYGGVSHTGLWASQNSPAVRGNRTYITTSFYDTTSKVLLPPSRLYAIDVDRPDLHHATLHAAWAFPFTGPTGASPLVIENAVYFDGAGPAAGPSATPVMFGVADLTSSYRMLWMQNVPGFVPAAAALDPRGGLWVYSARYPDLYRLDAGNGRVLQTIDMGALLGGATPASCMTISGPASAPVMLVSAGVRGVSSYLTAVNLVGGRLAWSYELGQGSSADAMLPYGQYPLVSGPLGPEVVFSTSSGGVLGLANVSQPSLGK